MDGTIGVVLSGGGARGAYEFGALEVLAPVLDEPARVMVGTSAGALGAAYLAANVHRGLEAAARSGGEKWLEVEIGDVIGPLCSPRELARLLLYGLELLGVRAPAPPSLLDTSPQPETIAALIDFEQLARNVEDGTLATAAVVATAYATARSAVFHSGGQSPPADDRRGIDYVATALAVEHVQASSAIQSLFPAVLVGERWYGDGGVRLNTPLKPALKLNADRLVVIGLNSVAGPPLEYDDRRPDVFDGAAAVAQSLLADQLAHDVDTLSTINDDVKESRQPITHRLVPYIFVAPADRLEIGRLATDVYNRHFAGARGLHHNRELALLGRLLDAAQPGPRRPAELPVLCSRVHPAADRAGPARRAGLARSPGASESLAHRAPVACRGASGLSTTPFTSGIRQAVSIVAHLADDHGMHKASAGTSATRSRRSLGDPRA